MKIFAFLFLIGIALASENDLNLNQEFLDGYNQFTGNVYNELRKSNSGNFLVSPLSVDILLSLIEYGSEGETSKEIIKGLCLPKNKEQIHEAFSLLTPRLNVNDKYTLTSANKIFVKQGRKLLENFQKLALDVYNSEVETINFNDRDDAAKEMNTWVQEKTHNKIKSVVNKNLINQDTRVLLLNALYFHGNWVTKFNKNHTKKADFFLDTDSKTEVELMDNRHNYNYYKSDELNAGFLELPYNGNEVTMTIVLPNEKNGLKKLEDNIDKVLVAPQYTRERVHVKLPKFKIESQINFDDVLKTLGITTVFEDTAKLFKINGEPLKISKVVQKTLIDVEEEGTTAAAATATYVTVLRSSKRPPTEFIADHPFIFYLKYQSVVLFIGHFTGK